METRENTKSPSQITDVVHFFTNITEDYLFFESKVLKLTETIYSYSPQQLSKECAKINTQRNQLTSMDEQMFDILKLAGKELAEQPMINDYHIALTRANLACNGLSQKLHEVKHSLQKQMAQPANDEVFIL